MIKIVDPSKCCGCSACVNVCHHHAISMQPDKLGFLYPVVDQAKCVDCGLCDKVCSFVPDVEDVMRVPQNVKVEVLAARHKDSEILAQSQSGGAFSAMAEQVLNDGGLVYGAAFDDSHMVYHRRVDSLEGLAALRGSKYVQSDIRGRYGEIFGQILGDLNNGFKVLFTGTPCQVAGLKSYIPENLQERLFTLDFVCHGVPSPAVWKDYLDYMSRHGKIVKANFRDKSVAGWKEHKETFIYNNGKKNVADSFRVLFYKNIMLRHSCSVCPYNVINHKSDVTIADFWGYKEMGIANDEKGLSLICVYTERGKAAVDGTRECFVLNPLDETNVQYAYRKKSYSAAALQRRANFLETVRKSSFMRVIKQEDFKFGKIGILTKIFIRKVRKVVGK